MWRSLNYHVPITWVNSYSEGIRGASTRHMHFDIQYQYIRPLLNFVEYHPPARMELYMPPFQAHHYSIIIILLCYCACTDLHFCLTLCVATLKIFVLKLLRIKCQQENTSSGMHQCNAMHTRPHTTLGIQQIVAIICHLPQYMTYPANYMYLSSL